MKYPDNLLKTIVDKFVHETQGMNTKTLKYKEAHYHYFVGSMRTLEALGYEMPPIWVISLMTNRSCVDNTPL